MHSHVVDLLGSPSASRVKAVGELVNRRPDGIVVIGSDDGKPATSPAKCRAVTCESRMNRCVVTGHQFQPSTRTPP